jgi:hypothetical protein
MQSTNRIGTPGAVNTFTGQKRGPDNQIVAPPHQKKAVTTWDKIDAV